MIHKHRIKAVFVVVMLIALGGGTAVATNPGTSLDSGVSQSTQTDLLTTMSSTTLIVNKSNSTAYDTIQNAVDNATDDARIEIRPGTYRESVTIEKNITLIAPEGATLNGSSFSTYTPGIEIINGSHAAPVISGFEITRYNVGVHAQGEGDWTVRETTIRNSSIHGIDAIGSSGNWTVRQSLIINSSAKGIVARQSTGDWIVRTTTITNSSSYNIGAVDSAGDWTVRGSLLTDSSLDGVKATSSAGNWTIQNTSITNNSAKGVSARESIGAWTIQDTRVLNSASSGIEVGLSTGSWLMENVTIRNSSKDGVGASRTLGDWVIQNTTITSSSSHGINGIHSTGNWTIQHASIIDSSEEGIRPVNSSGNWIIRNTKIDRSRKGIGARASSGNWTVQGSHIANSSEINIDARDSTGTWAVQESIITNMSSIGLNARSSDPAGNATRNFWGAADGPSGDFGGSGVTVVGNVQVKPFYTDANLTTLAGEPTTCVADRVSGSDDTIGLSEIQTAINWWAEGSEVPDTGGETISLTQIQSLINAWAEGKIVSCDSGSDTVTLSGNVTSVTGTSLSGSQLEVIEFLDEGLEFYKIPLDETGDFEQTVTSGADVDLTFFHANPGAFDGVPVLYGLDVKEGVTTDADLGTYEIPEAHRVDVRFVDNNSNPIKGLNVGFRSLKTGSGSPFKNITNEEGYVAFDGNNKTGVELVGEVGISLRPEDGSPVRVKTIMIPDTTNVTIVVDDPEKYGGTT